MVPNINKTEMYVDDRLRYVYCLISKVACTSWKRVTLMLTGRMRVNRTTDLRKRLIHDVVFSDKYLDRLHVSYNPEEIQHRLDNYFKFMFVRDPFERLVSAYRELFVKQNRPYHRTHGRRIVRMYRDNSTNESSTVGIDVTFEEFVRYILDPIARRELRVVDRHWRSFHETCHPCYVRYDFIGKFETLQEDAAYVIKRLGGGVEFPNDPDNSWMRSRELVVKMRRNISDATYRRLRELYALDYELFDYS